MEASIHLNVFVVFVQTVMAMVRTGLGSIPRTNSAANRPGNRPRPSSEAAPALFNHCGISCEFGCACMSDVAGCECWCENVSLPPLAKLKVRAARDPEAYVDFAASEMPLTRLAEMFDDLFPGQILIPAGKLNETVTTGGALRRIKLADLVEHVGLVPRSRPLRRTTST